MQERKGATSMARVEPDVLAALERGEIETRTLSEWLAVDQIRLAQTVLAVDATGWWEPKTGPLKRMEAVGRWLANHGDPLAFQSHPSDIVRGWAAYARYGQPGVDLAERLDRARPFAADGNMSVREVAWFAIRPFLAAEIELGLELLPPWTQEADPNLRRFASEATRPRGVWCSHIGTLKQRPELGEPLLVPLMADRAQYVQLSVANWLNDAGKTRADWLREFTARFESGGPDTQKILKRARRNLTA